MAMQMAIQVERLSACRAVGRAGKGVRFIARFALIGRNYKLFYARLEPFYGYAIATDLDGAPFTALWSFSAFSSLSFVCCKCYGWALHNARKME